MRIAPTDRKKVHVLQVTFGMGIGGMERVIMDLCRYVDPERFRFSICCLSVRGVLADQMETEGVPVHYFQNQTRLARYFRGFGLARLVSDSQVQVLHTHHTTAFVDGAIARCMARVPVLVNTDHCKLYPFPWRRVLLERLSSMVANEVVAVSEHTRADLIRHEGIAPEKISVIYNGVNVRLTRQDSAGELRRELGIPQTGIVIGAVARLEEQKGLDLLLRAVPVVLAQQPEAWFVLVGGGSREEALKELVAALGISHRVLFTGWRRDAVDLIQTFDCYVSSSNFEGMPMSMLEAMALAKPIVSTAVGGIPEFVRPGETGVLVSTRDPRQFADAILSVIATSGEAARLGANGKRLYETRFTAEAMAQQYGALYEKHLARSRVRRP